MTNKERIDAFMRGLEELTRLHRIAIGGCGCCGSPFLAPLADAELSPDHTYVAVRHNDGFPERIEWDAKP